jgi:hypothetical protein
VIAAGVGMQTRAPLRRHADKVSAFVQNRVQRRIEARENLRSHQPRLAFAPIRAGDDFLRRHQPQCQAVAVQEYLQGYPINAVEQKHSRSRAPALLQTRESAHGDGNQIARHLLAQDIGLVLLGKLQRLVETEIL